jgi:hypothetical protein
LSRRNKRLLTAGRQTFELLPGCANSVEKVRNSDFSRG